jgi:hypothetical protein
MLFWIGSLKSILFFTAVTAIFFEIALLKSLFVVLISHLFLPLPSSQPCRQAVPMFHFSLPPSLSLYSTPEPSCFRYACSFPHRCGIETAIR